MVELSTGRYPVRRTPKQGLRQVDFIFDGNEIRGLEQNPKTKSRWAEMARSGVKVMQFLIEGRYVANVAGEKTTLYGQVREHKPLNVIAEERRRISARFYSYGLRWLSRRYIRPARRPRKQK